MKILGLDLGVTSIGWALIEKNNENGEIDLIKSGVRIIPIETKDANQFISGNTASQILKDIETYAKTYVF